MSVEMRRRVTAGILELVSTVIGAAFLFWSIQFFKADERFWGSLMATAFAMDLIDYARRDHD